MSNTKEYEYKMFQRAKWVKVFYHTIVNGVQFESLEEAKYIVDNADKY